MCHDDSDLVADSHKVANFDNLGTGWFCFQDRMIISRTGVLVKNFVASYDKIVFVVKHDRDHLALGEHTARTCCVGVDNRGALRVGNFNGDHVIVYDINNPEQGRGNN